jgi:hypothetical protein
VEIESAAVFLVHANFIPPSIERVSSNLDNGSSQVHHSITDRSVSEKSGSGMIPVRLDEKRRHMRKHRISYQA